MGLGLGLAGGLAAAASRPAAPEPMYTPKQEPSYAYNPPPPEPAPPPPPPPPPPKPVSAPVPPPPPITEPPPQPAPVFTPPQPPQDFRPKPRRGGGGCPAPWVNILLANGGLVKAGDIQPGMEVYTRHEHTNEWGVFPVSVVRPGTDERWMVKFEDGREFVGTFNHPVMVDGKWVEIQDLKSGDKIVQPEGFAVVKSSDYHDHGPIVKIEVKDAHTYISEGFLSHNKQMIEEREQEGRYWQQEFANGGLVNLLHRHLSKYQ